MSRNPEVTEGIRIADKHLAGESVERRHALAADIAEAMTRNGGAIAQRLINRMLEAVKGPKP